MTPMTEVVRGDCSFVAEHEKLRRRGVLPALSHKIFEIFPVENGEVTLAPMWEHLKFAPIDLTNICEKSNAVCCGVLFGNYSSPCAVKKICFPPKGVVKIP